MHQDRHSKVHGLDDPEHLGNAPHHFRFHEREAAEVEAEVQEVEREAGHCHDLRHDQQGQERLHADGHHGPLLWPLHGQ